MSSENDGLSKKQVTSTPSHHHTITPSHHHTITICLYFILTLIMTWPLASQFTQAIPGDGFDGWQNYWNLWWVKIALIDRIQNPFYTDILYAPTGVDLYFHTLNPFNGLVTLPIQLTSGLIAAYNTVVLISWSLGGYGVYLLTQWVLRERRPNRAANQAAHRTTHLAAFIAGLIFTFSPFHMAHLLGHMQVMSLQWTPFYILYLLRAQHQIAQPLSGRVQSADLTYTKNPFWKKYPWLRSALLAGLFLILTGLCDWYFVLYLFLFTGLVTIWHVVHGLISRRLRLTFAVFPPAVAGLLFLVVLSPILIPMIRQATEFSFMVRPVTDLYILSASVLDFIVPNRLHTWFRPDSFGWPGNLIAPVSERTISIGYLPLILAGIAIWQRKYSSVAFWLICALFFMMMALGPEPHLGSITREDIPSSDVTTITQQWTPYSLLNELIPFMRISRSVSRYALMVQLAVAILAGMGLASLLNPSTTSAFIRARPRPISLLVAFVCIPILLAEYWVAPYPMSPPDTPSVYQQLEKSPSGTMLNLPMNYDRPGYLLYQTVHQQPLAVAYISRDDPRTLTERAPVLQHFRHLGPDILDIDPAQVGMTVLHDLGIRTVVLDRYKMPGGLEREYTSTLAQTIFDEQASLYEDDRITAYAVQEPAELQPYMVLGPLNWGPLQKYDEQDGRPLLGEATLQFYHAPDDAQIRVVYQTPAEMSVRVTAPALAQTITTLPPAIQPAEVLLDLGMLRERASISTQIDTLSVIGFVADGAGPSPVIYELSFVE
ncbi:MAG: hypothetical protein AAF639_23710 [Chloroflexota bacterium]